MLQRRGEVRYLAAVMVLAGLLAGCGSSSTASNAGSAPSVPSTATATSVPTPPPPRSRCITAGGYKGLYSTMSAFTSDHTMAAPSVPTDGIDWNTILSTEHGCVTAYSADELASPPLGAADIMFLTDGIYLPDDRNDVLDKDNCTLYSSATLTRASGYKFAVVTGTAQDGQTPAHAEIHLTNNGSCSA